jgi:RNA polymerase subunit RPABC4/transcription elongation factor Spt4
METKTYHGKLTPGDIGRALVAEFDHGNLQAHLVENPDRVLVQIASRTFKASGGQTAMTVTLEKVEDGVLVQLGDQQMLGVAADLGATALFALRNPISLIGRLDGLAQDITALQLSDSVWQTIQKAVNAAGAGLQISDRLRRLECSYCGAAVPVGEATCPMCGAPLGAIQPKACPHCGFVPPAGATVCPNCHIQLI